jgi:dipeptidyl aminopeptidase/acylaminoacyl peptidase
LGGTSAVPLEGPASAVRTRKYFGLGSLRVSMRSGEPRPPFERFAQHWTYGMLAWTRPGELVYTTNITGQFNAWRQAVGPRGERGYARPVTAHRSRTVRALVPTRDGRTLFFSADEDGDEQFQVYRVALDGGDPAALTADRTVRHELGSGAVDPLGRQLLYVDNARSPADMDVVVHDLRRGTTRRPLATDLLWSSPTWDPAGRRFFALQIRSNTRVRSFVHDLRRGTTVELLPHETEENAIAHAWSPDGRGIFLTSNLGREHERLEYVDVTSGRSKVVFDPPHGVESCAVAERAGTIVCGVNEEGYTVLYTGRPGARWRRVPGLPRGCVLAVWGPALALTADGRQGSVIWHTGTRPAEVVWFSLPTGRPTTLTDSMPGGVPGGPLPAPRLVRFRSFDGRWIPAFYYAPRRRSAGRSPAVLSIHGGPEGQERPAWLYAGLYAYLASRGIYVLAPNIRGSSGYGQSYQKLIHHDWGGNELKDLRAAAEWLRARPEVDGQRLGVYGGSFGGFATLSCLSRLPEYWKAGVDIVGPSNLITFVKSVPPFWVRFMDEWVGNPMTEAKFLRDRSPISYIDQVRADVLVIQGANDPRVNRAESDQMVEQLRARGRRVDYLVFDDEGHGFTKTENLLKAIGTSARFLSDHLLPARDPTT